MGGPYVKYDDPSKISAFLSWTGDKGFQLYKNIDWERKDMIRTSGRMFGKLLGRNSSPGRLLCSPGISWATFTVHTVKTKQNS